MSKLSQLKDKRKETAADKVCAPFIDQIYSDEKQLYFEFSLEGAAKIGETICGKGLSSTHPSQGWRSVHHRRRSEKCEEAAEQSCSERHVGKAIYGRGRR